MKANIKDKFKWGIYCIKNTVNNKIYVGKSINIYGRIKQHITQLNHKSKDENYHLINAWHKYGRKAFTYDILEYLEFERYDENSIKLQLEKLAARELYWIQKLNTLDRNIGYNMRLDASTKCLVLDETRERCRNAQIERFKDPKEREKIAIQSRKLWTNESLKRQMARNCAFANRKYRIGKFDKENNLIKIYEIINDIKLENPDYYLQAIRGCCQGTKASYKGYKWHYIELNSEQIRYKNYDIVENK